MTPFTFWHRVDRLLARLRRHRQPLALLTDAAVIAATWNFTYLFRLGFERWVDARPSYDLLVMLGVIAVYLLVFSTTGIPRCMWRFSGFGEVKRLTLACLAAGLLSAAAVLLLGLSAVPRAVLALHPAMALMGLCFVRVAYRMLYEHVRAQITGGDAEVRRAIVLGAGEAARLLLAGIHQQGWIVLGLLDDDPAKQGARIAGLPVLGRLADVSRPQVLAGASHLIVALPGASASRRRRALELAGATGLPVLTVPSASELQKGRVDVARVRDIEPEDLLGREPVQLDEGGIAECLSGKVVLITGAGGSIGSELCRQVARYRPSRIVLFELSEFALYNIEQDLSQSHPTLPLERLIGDVRDFNQLRHTFARFRPQVVFHAAAYKHVPLMEHDNAAQALRNNTLGTFHAATAAAEAGVERFVLISTDKAVNPSSVMGATKRAAEMMISQLAADAAAASPRRRTRFIAVRFGNVLGSSGSVIPKFKEQIARGGPVTVTHPDMTRYFMTIPEAARLVLQAAALGEGGQVYVLDMGEPIRIVDLARELIKLAGRTPAEVPIVFSGLRPGEKLHEELLAGGDTTLPTAIAELRIAQLQGEVDRSVTREWVAAAIELTGAGNDIFGAPTVASDAAVKLHLRRLVPEYVALGLDDEALMPVDPLAAIVA